MPTAWETFPVEIRGGLVTNLSPLQQGIRAPGSARSLINFEPSTEGGYRRILGYTKFSESFIPPYGEPLVQGASQTGTSLVLANVSSIPAVGAPFTIAGVAGTYTVSAVTYNSTTKSATLTVSPSLNSSPADRAVVTFSNTTTDVVNGLVYYKQNSLVYRGGDLWKSSGLGWTKINKPSYGTVLVNGGSQTGTTLAVDGLTAAPQIGDTFTVGGVQKVYTVVSAVTVVSGGASLTISPSLDSSPADNAAITFLSTSRAGGNKHRFARYNYTGTNKVCGVDGVNKPFNYDGTTFTVLNAAPSDLAGANHVVEFKNHLFFSKNNSLTFTAPYSDNDFSAANGAGSILVPHTITGLIVFREQLIIFSTNAIHRLVGNTIADFQLQPVSQDIGCVREDTVQEVGGDIAFLGPDGVRLLGATDRIGDFGLAVASRPIQNQVKRLTETYESFCSCTVRAKNQYRLFGYSSARARTSSEGVLATQFADQTAEGMAWAELRGIMANVVDSIYSNADASEVILFANRDGFVYRMEDGNTFAGSSIPAFYYTPYFSITDPKLRKTLFRLTTYTDPTGGISGKVTPRLDFDEPGIVQPSSIEFATPANSANVYGRAVYGVSIYGGKLRTTLTTPLVGSGLTVSLEYAFENSDPPFSIDTLTLEYLNNDRQ